MSRHAVRTGMVAITTALTLAMAASAALAAPPRILTSDGIPQSAKILKVKPSRIIWTGDATGVFAGRGTPSRHPNFGRLHWSKWTASEARATGANWLNDCIPFCAAGKYTPHNVKLTAYRPRVLAGFKMFTRLRVVYTGKVPRGDKRTSVFSVERMNNALFWRFPT
jgi:hypothetical protein